MYRINTENGFWKHGALMLARKDLLDVDFEFMFTVHILFTVLSLLGHYTVYINIDRFLLFDLITTSKRAVCAFT